MYVYPRVYKIQCVQIIIPNRCTGLSWILGSLPLPLLTGGVKLPLCSLSPLRDEDIPGYAPHPEQLDPSSQGVKIPWPVEFAPIPEHLTELNAERKKIMKTGTVLIIERYKFVLSLQGFPGVSVCWGRGGETAQGRGQDTPGYLTPGGHAARVVGGGARTAKTWYWRRDKPFNRAEPQLIYRNRWDRLNYLGCWDTCRIFSPTLSIRSP